MLDQVSILKTRLQSLEVRVQELERRDRHYHRDAPENVSKAISDNMASLQGPMTASAVAVACGLGQDHGMLIQVGRALTAAGVQRTRTGDARLFHFPGTAQASNDQVPANFRRAIAKIRPHGLMTAKEISFKAFGADGENAVTRTDNFLRAMGYPLVVRDGVALFDMGCHR